MSLATVAVIGMGDFTGSVNSLCFSRADSGSLLAAIDDSPDKIISVWEWQRGEKGHKITETRVSILDSMKRNPRLTQSLTNPSHLNSALWTQS